ncbi:hypothetical protein [Algoriphagus boritolerans]|uniref:hypothetical protein n=1 Tax=Algoriphagus boritolerans TaxID=308111 RepID=UPI000B1DBE35
MQLADSHLPDKAIPRKKNGAIDWEMMVNEILGKLYLAKKWQRGLTTRARAKKPRHQKARLGDANKLHPKYRKKKKYQLSLISFFP